MCLYDYVYRCLLQQYFNPDVESIESPDDSNYWGELHYIDSINVLAEAEYPLGDDTELANEFITAADHRWCHRSVQTDMPAKEHASAIHMLMRRSPEDLDFHGWITDEEIGYWTSDVALGHFQTLHTLQVTRLLKIALAGLELYRGRIDSFKTFHSSEELGSPPPQLAKHQRLSPEGMSCFYAGEDSNTAEIETGWTGKELLSLGRWRTTADLCYVDFAQDIQIPDLFDYPRSGDRAFLEFLHEFIQQISYPAYPEMPDVQESYSATQAFAQFLRNSVEDDAGRLVQAIRYPSSISEKGVNWMIYGRPDHQSPPLVTLDSVRHLT